MKRIVRSFFICCLTAAFFAVVPIYAFSEKASVYISPNNDGVQDALIVPIKITDKRYIQAWSLVIQDKDGKVIRTIGNKVALPEKLTFKTFFKQLITPKHGVDVPSSVSWNGVMNDGKTAPDGEYYYYLTATDDNGNVGYAPDIKKTSPLKVIVDNTAPTVTVEQPSANNLTFGEGSKSELSVNQNGSSEDLWTGEFKNAVGEVVRTMKWVDSEPLSFRWSGNSDDGTPVADGVYSYTISATDRAGNKSAAASISNIIFSAEKPQTNISISGSKYFSPGTSSPLGTITLNVVIPLPTAGSGNRLTDWAVDIIGTDGKIYCSFKPSAGDMSAPPKQIVYDGKDDSGTRIPEGTYQARVTAKYLNGYEPALVLSPVFMLDVTPPDALLRVSDKIFSPDGDGVKDTVTINENILPDKGSPVKNWTGTIVSSEDPTKIVRQYDLGEFPPDEIVWNGIDGSGKLVPDGAYNYILSATDLAGNVCRKQTDSSFAVDTSKTEVLLSLGNSAFSPNNDHIKDTMPFDVVTKTRSAITRYEFDILNANGHNVKTVTGSGKLPSVLTWDGKDDGGILSPDGKYTAALTVDSENGSHVRVGTQPFVLDTKPPFLTASVPWTAFSPDGDGNQDTIPVTVAETTDENLWTAKVLDSSGKIVRTYTWQHKIETKDEDGIIKTGFDWDGTDESGNTAPDGTYSIVISSEDDAGNSFSTTIKNIVLDTRPTKAYVTTSLSGISPNNDGIKDVQKFTIRTTLSDGIASWKFDIRRADGVSVRTWSSVDQPNVPAEITWDGLDSAGKVAEGTFTGTLTIQYIKGNHVTSISPAFLCSVTPPVLKVATAPEYFSPDNDGVDDDLFIKLSGDSTSALKKWSFTINNPADEKAFWTISGTSTITERIIWDGTSNTSKDADGFAECVQSAMDYPWHFTATDDLGMTSSISGKISVDVLVIRDGDVLKMAVPSIIFRSNYADFKTSDTIKGGLDPEKAANNERVLKRVAEILNKFKDYKVTIVGHANRTTNNEDEETVDNPRLWGPALIPLSQSRADYVKSYLVDHGVSASRLTTEGKGGTEPVVDWTDKDNNWKNRRVEFILEK